MVKAVTQTAPDVEIGWSRRRHASRRRSGGVRHNKINQNTKKLTDKPEKPEFFPKGVIYGLQESQDNLDEIANEIGATYMHWVGDPNNSKTTLVAFEKNTDLPPFVEIDNRKYKIHPFIPTPKRCNKCQLFGHHWKQCYREAVCSR